MKVNRNFEYVLTVCQDLQSVEQENRSGEFMFKSECHYYAEKEIIGAVKAAEKAGLLEQYKGHVYCIYKEQKATKVVETRENEDGEKITVEKTIPGTAVLVETIQLTDEGLIIR